MKLDGALGQSTEHKRTGVLNFNHGLKPAELKFRLEITTGAIENSSSINLLILETFFKSICNSTRL